MRKQLLAVTLGVLVMASAALAGDPWKDKKPSDWKQADVDRILKDSPWAREYDLMTNRSDLGNNPNDLNNASNSLTDLSQGAGGGGGRRGRSSSSSGDSQQQPRAITYYAQWYSARTIRAAQARSSELAGSVVPPDSPILKVPQNYQVMVHGGDLRPFDKLGDELKKSSYLELKSTHQRLTPERIVILQSKSGRAIAIVYEFAKKTATGEPAVPGGEKSVEFVSAANDISLHFKFDVSKMADAQGSDL